MISCFSSTQGVYEYVPFSNLSSINCLYFSGVTHFAALLLPLSEIPQAVDGFEDDDASSLSSCSGSDIDEEEEEECTEDIYGDEEHFEKEEEVVFMEGSLGKSHNGHNDIEKAAHTVPVSTTRSNSSDMNTAIIVAAGESAAVESDSSLSKRQFGSRSESSEEDGEDSATRKRRSNGV